MSQDDIFHPPPPCGVGCLSAAARQVALTRAHQAQRARQRRLSRQTTTGARVIPVNTWGEETGAGASTRQRTGYGFERRAARHLEAAGLHILAHNVTGRSGEIDLIALDQTVLVFVEVRSRADARFGGAAASVNRAKQRRIVLTASGLLPRLGRLLNRSGAWCARTGTCRFDVVAFEGDTLHWFRNAFTGAPGE